MPEETLPVVTMIDDAETAELRWPGDMLTVPHKLRITHEMLGITKVDQSVLVAKAQAGGVEGRNAMVKLLTVRNILWRALEELDLCRDPKTKRVRSRWVPDPEQSYVKGMNHGAADDYQRFFDRNFFDYFRRMQLLELDVLGKEDRERLSKQNITPEFLRETVTQSDSYSAVSKWCKAIAADAAASAEDEVGGELQPRAVVAERVSGVPQARRRPPKTTRDASIVPPPFKTKVLADAQPALDAGGVMKGGE